MIKLDWRVLGFTIFISFLTGIAFGLMPALRGSALDLNQALKDGGKTGTVAERSALGACWW